jgi:glycosyltransferase involved in cell wall biosynthesis
MNWPPNPPAINAWSSKMRIGFDGSVLSSGTRYTGTGQYAQKLLEVMPGLARDDNFVVYGEKPDDGIRCLSNVEWRPLRGPRIGKLSALVSHLWTLPSAVKRDRIDVLHIPTVHTRPSLPPVPRRVACPMVVTLHDVIPITYYERHGAMPWRLRRYYRWNLGAVRRASAIITVSESARREIIETLGVADDRISTVYNGVDSGFWSSCENDVRNPAHGVAPYVLFGGSYEPRKNLIRLLEAFDIAVQRGLPHRLVAIVDAGSGHEGAVRAAADRLRSRDRVEFVSGLDDAILRVVYQGADMFVFPSLSEGFGLPPLQAMASGVPVIASDLPVMREVLGAAALYVDPYSPDGIANAMTRMAPGPERDRLVKFGREQAARYSWLAAAEQTLDVYRRVVAVRVAAGTPR